MTVKEIRIEFPKYSVFSRIYITNNNISNFQVSEFAQFARMLVAHKDFEKLGDIKDLLEIPGVSEVLISANYLRIWIRAGFIWKDVEPSIIEFLYQTLDKKLS